MNLKELPMKERREMFLDIRTFRTFNRSIKITLKQRRRNEISGRSIETQKVRRILNRLY